MKTAKLCFRIKRAIVSTEDVEDEVLAVISKCIKLCEKRHYRKAKSLLLPLLYFQWDWDFDPWGESPSVIFEELPHIGFHLDSSNSVLGVGERDGKLCITVAAFFEAKVKDGLTIDEINDWLGENAFECAGYICGGWGYSWTDEDRVWVYSID